MLGYWANLALINYGPKWSWAEMVMGRNGYGPKWSWAEMVMGRNDPEPKKCKILSQLVPIKWRRPFMSHSNLASSVISREFDFIRFRPLSFETVFTISAQRNLVQSQVRSDREIKVYLQCTP